MINSSCNKNTLIASILDNHFCSGVKTDLKFFGYPCTEKYLLVGEDRQKRRYMKECSNGT